MKTKTTWGNCYFALFYMFIRGKVDKIVFVNSGSIWFPAHMLILNKWGNALHYNFAVPEIGKAPLVFVGYFEGIRRSIQAQELRKRDKRVLATIDCNWKINPLILLSWAILHVPFLVAMVLYLHIWVITWSLDAVRKRNVRRR